MSRMWAGFVSKVLKIGAFYILRLQKTSETHQLNVKSMPFSKLLGNESAHIGNSALTPKFAPQAIQVPDFKLQAAVSRKLHLLATGCSFCGSIGPLNILPIYHST